MKLVASSVVSGDRPGSAPGGIYLIDLEGQSVRQAIDTNDGSIQWNGRGREVGFRGIACSDNRLYAVASDELFVYTPTFELVDSWQNPYLKHCRGISVFERKLLIASAGFDSIVGFDLDQSRFDWAMHVQREGAAVGFKRFDPASDDGPILLGKLDIRSLWCDETGMYINIDQGLLRFNSKALTMAVELPPDARDARPYRDGVLFNDTEAGSLRYSGRGEGDEDRALPLPQEAGFARGLCQLNTTVFAAGASPAAVTVYDLAANETLLSVQLSDDERTSIHSIAAWPYD